jgi:hypothetical protein
LNGAYLRDNAASAEFSADRRDDRDRKICRSAKGTHGDRLEPRKGTKNGLDAAAALGQSHRACDLVDELISQRREGRTSRRHARLQGARRSL